MTTIITDGKSMAADRMGQWCGRITSRTKIERIGDKIVGISGCYGFGRRLIAWYKSGADYEKFPDNEQDWSMIIIGKDGIMVALQHAIVPMDDFKYVAIGSGQDFAISAAYLGKNMKEAIEFAIEHDADTGIGVDILHLE